MTRLVPGAHLNVVLALLLATAHPIPAQNEPLENIAAEAALATTFNHLRATDDLRPLTFLPDHTALRQLTCTAAHTDQPPLHPLSLEANAAAILYRTATPLTPNADFLRVAAYNDRGADPSHKITRFAISVWPDANDPNLSWVGVALYWSHLRQFVAIHVTRLYKPPNLRPYLAPACVNVR